MSHPTEVPGEGTLLQIKISAAFVTIGQRVSISGPSIDRGDIPTVHLDSLQKTGRPSRQPKVDDLKLSLFYDPNDATTHQVLRSRVAIPANLTTIPADDLFQLVFNDGDTTPAMEAFGGYIKTWELNGMEEDTNLGADVTIRINSGPVATAGTP